jgi:secretion/DNA translocation related TadE-like protein
VSAGERGSASIVVAAMLGAAVVMALGAADVGRVLVQLARAQTAADAAALAAAQELAIPGGLRPAEVAAEYAAANGAQLNSCTCPIGAVEAVVEVDVAVGDLLLAGEGRTVTARARAVVDLP